MTVQIIASLIVSVFGCISVFMLLSLNKKLGGKISGGVSWLIMGITFITLGFVWSSFLPKILSIAQDFGSFGNQIFGFNDVNALFVLFGMICFMVSARKLSKLIRED